MRVLKTKALRHYSRAELWNLLQKNSKAAAKASDVMQPAGTALQNR